jgi:hypothetical protein
MQVDGTLHLHRERERAGPLPHPHRLVASAPPGLRVNVESRTAAVRLAEFTLSLPNGLAMQMSSGCGRQR